MIESHPGVPLPLGAHVFDGGTQFSIFSRNAESVSLILFHTHEPDSTYGEIYLDPWLNRTGDIWHIWIEGISEGQYYGYRMDGPYHPVSGHRFNKNRLLIDPCARALSGNYQWDLLKARETNPHGSIPDTKDSIQHVPRSIVVTTPNRQDDHPIPLHTADTIIYELHVKGFTRHENAGVTHPGTYLGLTEKIPYLKELGVTAVELMPVQEFDEDENININPETGERLKNYWGYSSMAFYAPHGRYAATGTEGQQVKEFRDMVKKFHEAGIAVYLDVVFNHTSEGDELGPTLSFRGIDNTIYYILDENKSRYSNYSGCGNTFNCNHPHVRNFILDALRYWVIHMNVDGFRFDLASILGRDQDGAIMSNPPLLEIIEEDPILRNTDIIAEAWDAAGAYQVGSFPGRWAEWNGKYRDDIRRFWRGDTGSAGDFATRITGSADLYASSGRSPYQSINFITCHDGFTMNDLVSYRNKHNEMNGEKNRDGENHNISCNYGIEGPTDDPVVEMARKRQIKNFLATLFLSQGTPMLYMGDEFRRTQQGNNNAYCQDNEISWVDWESSARHQEILRFTREIIAFRKEHPLLRRSRFFQGRTYDSFSAPDIVWRDSEGNPPHWDDSQHLVCAVLHGGYTAPETGTADSDLCMIFNSGKEKCEVLLPQPPQGGRWYRVIDTSRAEGEDIATAGNEQPVIQGIYMVSEMSTVVLIQKPL